MLNVNNNNQNNNPKIAKNKVYLARVNEKVANNNLKRTNTYTSIYEKKKYI